MKICILVFLGCVLSLNFAKAYSPVFPHEPYYFQSQSKKFLAEVTPSVMHSRDSKYLLVNKSQALAIYKKGDHNSWDEINTFQMGKMDLIKEVLIPDEGFLIVIRVDENPMTREISKDEAIFVYLPSGKRVAAHSHFSVFGKPGIFRDMNLELDSRGQILVKKDTKLLKSIPLPKNIDN